VIGWKLSRTIIDIPWLHNTIGFLFIILLLSYILVVIYGLYRITRFTREKRTEWTFEGKNWDYWRTHK
jgi:hypothetical protein